MSDCQVRISVNNLDESRAFYQTVLEPARLYPSATRSDGAAVGFAKRWLPPVLWLVSAGEPLTSDLDSDLYPKSDTPAATQEGSDLTQELLKDSEIEGIENGSGRFGNEPKGPVVSRGVYICLTVDSRPAVDGFYKASLASGGKSVVSPGVHPKRGRMFKWYYRAVIEDPEGRLVELACRTAPVFAGKYGGMIKIVCFLIYLVILFTQLK